MKRSEFEKTIKESVGKIPKKFRLILKKENIELYAKEKTPSVIQGKNKNNLIFGVFVGIPYNKRSVFNIQKEPARIELYKKSFEEAFSDKEDMKNEIIKTVIHEIGHYFGFSEKELKRYYL